MHLFALLSLFFLPASQPSLDYFSKKALKRTTHLYAEDDISIHHDDLNEANAFTSGKHRKIISFFVLPWMFSRFRFPTVVALMRYCSAADVKFLYTRHKIIVTEQKDNHN